MTVITAFVNIKLSQYYFICQTIRCTQILGSKKVTASSTLENMVIHVTYKKCFKSMTLPAVALNTCSV
jgi:hypothetical protein